jgi:hypothetical protein
VACRTGQECGADECGRPCGSCDAKAGTQCIGGRCVAPENAGPWEGWATTSQFGAGENEWPSGGIGSSISLNAVTNAAAQRMGAAIPWTDLPKSGYKSRGDQLNAIVDSARGKPLLNLDGSPKLDADGNVQFDKACFLVQPITRYADELTGITDPGYATSSNVCQGASCVNVNDPSIAATLGTAGTTAYPEYLIVPYEGCGGNCNLDRKVQIGTDAHGPTYQTAADCFNGCPRIQEFVTDFDAGAAAFDPADPFCGTINTLLNGKEGDNSKWLWTDKVHDAYLNGLVPGNDEIAVTKATGYGRDISNYVEKVKATGRPDVNVNYCSSQNMHFDTAITVPYWSGIGNARELTGSTQIMTRYKRVPCNVHGAFDPKVYGFAKNHGVCLATSECASNKCGWDDTVEYAGGCKPFPGEGPGRLGATGCCVPLTHDDGTCDAFGGCNSAAGQGFCATDHNGRHECSCVDGYYGLNCQNTPKLCPKPCADGKGKCNYAVGECICAEGYEGETCDRAVCNPPCDHGAPCVDKKCACPAGYTGPTCATPTGADVPCATPCTGNRTCGHDGTCVCSPGFEGSDCHPSAGPAPVGGLCGANAYYGSGGAGGHNTLDDVLPSDARGQAAWFALFPTLDPSSAQYATNGCNTAPGVGRPVGGEGCFMWGSGAWGGLANFKKAAAMFPGFMQSDNPTVNILELAAFLGNVHQETSGLLYSLELNSAPGSFFGKGALQLTGALNYIVATYGLEDPSLNNESRTLQGTVSRDCQALGTAYPVQPPPCLTECANLDPSKVAAPPRGAGTNLCSDPSVVSRDPVVAWAASLWYWMNVPIAGSSYVYLGLKGSNQCATAHNLISDPQYACGALCPVAAVAQVGCPTCCTQKFTSASDGAAQSLNRLASICDFARRLGHPDFQGAAADALYCKYVNACSSGGIYTPGAACPTDKSLDCVLKNSCGGGGGGGGGGTNKCGGDPAPAYTPAYCVPSSRNGTWPANPEDCKKCESGYPYWPCTGTQACEWAPAAAYTVPTPRRW